MDIGDMATQTAREIETLFQWADCLVEILLIKVRQRPADDQAPFLVETAYDLIERDIHNVVATMTDAEADLAFSMIGELLRYAVYRVSQILKLDFEWIEITMFRRFGAKLH